MAVTLIFGARLAQKVFKKHHGSPRQKQITPTGWLEHLGWAPLMICLFGGITAARRLLAHTLNLRRSSPGSSIGLGPIQRMRSVSRATVALPVVGLACTSRRGKNNKPSCAVLAGFTQRARRARVPHVAMYNL